MDPPSSSLRYNPGRRRHRWNCPELEVVVSQDEAQLEPPRPSRPGLPTMLAGIAILLGVLGGVGAITFQYAEGFSYFSSDPRACVNN